MGYRTTYDDKRDELRDTLKEALAQAKELVVGEDIWGYDEMREGYAMDVYVAIKKAIETV